MNLWSTVLVAAAAGFAVKFAGYVVPRRALQGPRVSRVTPLLPVALLSGLVATQAFTGAGGAPALDARGAAVVVAVVALRLRVPFLLMVILAAATAAGLRALGWG